MLYGSRARLTQLVRNSNKQQGTTTCGKVGGGPPNLVRFCFDVLVGEDALGLMDKAMGSMSRWCVVGYIYIYIYFQFKDFICLNIYF